MSTALKFFNLVSFSFFLLCASTFGARGDSINTIVLDKKHGVVKSGNVDSGTVIDVLAKGGAPYTVEINNKDSNSQEEIEHYVSPFDDKNVYLLSKKFSSIKSDFVVVDLHLSEIDILGYSEEARVASIKDIGIDPVDLSITNVSNSVTNDTSKEWVNWRNNRMKSLLVGLSAAYKKANPKGKFFIIGNADYYAAKDFNDLRLSQDWLSWAQTGAVDGVLLKGRWLSRYSDSDRLEYYVREWKNLLKNVPHPVALIPISGGQRWVPESNFTRDWKILKGRVPTFVRFALWIEDESDSKQANLFTSGKPIPVAHKMPSVGQLMPEFEFPDNVGQQLGPQDWVNKSSVLMVLLPPGSKPKPIVSILESASPSLKEKGILPVIVSSSKFDFETSVLTLLDKGRELLDLTENQPTEIQIDKAGWIRAWKPIDVLTLPSLPLSSVDSLENYKVELGAVAPDFVVTDMNGQLHRLSDLRGKKNLFLTFFPKCFTGRCRNHLASINDRLADFDAAQTEVWAVSVDPADVQRDFAAMWGFKFPLIPDVGRNLSLLYGAAKTTDQLSDRMSVLIDKTGKIVWIDKNVIVATHGSDVLKKMAELGLAKAN